MPLVLGYRFDAADDARLIERHGATFTVGAITAFIALLRERRGPLSSLTQGLQRRRADRARGRRGLRGALRRLHPQHLRADRDDSPSHAVPLGDARAGRPDVRRAVGRHAGLRAPTSRIVDEDGDDAAGRRGRRDRHRAARRSCPATGKPRRPRRSRDALHTGDVGFIDADGWFYVVDRKKDLINASGYKVWPREVEDVLYEHPAVHEAAVVGVPDDYRGETVRAFVVLAAGAGGRAGRADRLLPRAAGRLQVPARWSRSSTSCRRRRPARSCAASSGSSTFGRRAGHRSPRARRVRAGAPGEYTRTPVAGGSAASRRAADGRRRAALRGRPLHARHGARRRPRDRSVPRAARAVGARGGARRDRRRPRS